MKASEKMRQMYEAMQKISGGGNLTEEMFMEAWQAQMKMFPLALPALISIVSSVEGLQAAEADDWEGQIAAARYQALRALSDLEKVLENG